MGCSEKGEATRGGAEGPRGATLLMYMYSIPWLASKKHDTANEGRRVREGWICGAAAVSKNTAGFGQKVTAGAEQPGSGGGEET